MIKETPVHVPAFFLKVSDRIGQKEPSVFFHYCWCLQSHEGFVQESVIFFTSSSHLQLLVSTKA